MGDQLRTNGKIVLPDSLMAVVEKGPEILNARTCPYEPGLLQINGVELLAVRRTFETVQVCVGIYDGSWVATLSPADELPVLVTRTG
jgi:hypothetical protein